MSTRSAVVVGGGRGMALDAARHLGRSGHRVVVADLDGERAGAAERALRAEGVEATGVQLDACDRAAVLAVADRLVGDGGLDVLVAAVGGSAGTPRWLEEIERHHVEAVVRLCVGAALNVTDAFGPALRRAGGSITYVSSSAARLGDRSGWSPAYAASKAAVLGLARWIACDPAWMGVRANAVCPGDVLTERTLEIFAAGGWTEEEQDVIRHRRSSLGRMATSDELGRSIAALARDGFASGAILDVSGGELPTPA